MLRKNNETITTTTTSTLSTTLKQVQISEFSKL